MKELKLFVAVSDRCFDNYSDRERSVRLGDCEYRYTADDYRSSGCSLEERAGGIIRVEYTLRLLNQEKAITRALLEER